VKNLKPLSQVPRWDTVGSTRLQCAGALCDRAKILHQLRASFRIADDSQVLELVQVVKNEVLA